MTDYRFRCMGPYSFGTKISHRRRKKYRVFDPDCARDEVFEQAEADQHRIRSGEIQIDEIANAIGLYVIGMAPRGKLIPFYVGKAARQTIQQRLFQKTDKVAKIQAILNEYSRAKPFVFIFPMVTENGRLVKMPKVVRGTSQAEKIISNAEHMMIGHAMHANPWLHNISTVVARERFVIDGTPSASGTETKFARAYRDMMGFSRPLRGIKKIQEASIEAEDNEKNHELIAEDALAHPESLENEVLFDSDDQK